MSTGRIRLGGYLVSAWLVGIIIDLVLVGGYLDVALLDLGLSLGAFSLARLAEAEARVGASAPRVKSRGVGNCLNFTVRPRAVDPRL